MKRRHAVMAATALAAGGAGLGAAWWRATQQPPAVDSAFWALRFPRPEGGELSFAALRGRPWLLNFWATWCPPCIKEMPDLDRFHREHAPQGWQVVGIAIDNAEPVRQFLARRPVSFAIGIAGFEGSDLGKQLGNTHGQLPYTALFDATGTVRERKLGATTYEQLVRWARAHGTTP